MDWSPKQLAALAAVKAWHDEVADWTTGSDRQVFRLFGFAGSGKTTLAKEIARQIGGNVIFAAFTGKAALVLRRKGCPATTIHSLIYTPVDKSAAGLAEAKEELKTALETVPRDEDQCRLLARLTADEEKSLKRPAFSLNIDSEIRDATLVIIDEVSMVGEKMGADLLSFGVPILVLGDPAQLPPVADGGYFTESTPDVMLDEIHRQASGSPVIDLATTVRTGGSLTLGEYGTSRVIRRGTLPLEEIAKGYDIALCGRNATRRALNRRIRSEVLGRTSPFPEVGDRLVCLRNNHELGLLNGSLWTVEEIGEVDEKKVSLVLRGDEEAAGGIPLETLAHRAPFVGEEVSFYDRRDADEFDYGYALTTHKAQGSQWASVYVVDESGVFREHARRWLYTAVTRAAERVTVAS